MVCLAWELFVCGDEVIFSEVSPQTTRHRDGDAYLRDLSEFAPRLRAFQATRRRYPPVWSGRLPG